MKKAIFILTVLCGLSLGAFAQSSDNSTGKFSIGINPGLPVGDAHNVSNFAIGADLKYDLPIATNTFFNVSAGYTRFFYNGDTKDLLKSIGSDKSGEGFVPLKAGIKYFFNEGFYGEAQLGAVFSTESGGGTGFAYAPGVGYKLSDNLDLGVRYEGWSKDGTTSQIALRLGISF